MAQKQKKSRKKKKKNYKTLSKTQEVLYAVLTVLYVLIFLCFTFGFFKLKTYIIFQNPNILAYKNNVGILWLFVPVCTLMPLGVVLLEIRRSAGIPLISNRNDKKKAEKYRKIRRKWAKKNFEQWKDIKKWDKMDWILTLLLVVLLIGNLLGFVVPLYAHSTLSYNNEVKTHNTIKLRSDEVVNVVNIFYHHGGVRTSGGYQIYISCSNDMQKSYGFYLSDFKSREDFFEFIATCDAEKIFIDGKENIEALAEDIDLTSEQIALLHGLQEYSEKNKS